MLPGYMSLGGTGSFRQRCLSGGGILALKCLKEVTRAGKVRCLLRTYIRLGQHGVPFILEVTKGRRVRKRCLSQFRARLNGSFVCRKIIFNRSGGVFLRGVGMFVLPSFFRKLPVSLLRDVDCNMIPIAAGINSVKRVIGSKCGKLVVRGRSAVSVIRRYMGLMCGGRLVGSLSRGTEYAVFSQFRVTKCVSSLGSVCTSYLVRWMYVCCGVSCIRAGVFSSFK